MIATTITPVRGRPGRWRLAGVMTAAFADQPQFAGIRRWLLRLVFWVQLWLGDYRADPDGAAVCSVGTRSPVVKAKAIAAATVVLGILGGLIVTASITWPVVVGLVGVDVLYWPLARRSLRGIGVRRQLARARPVGAVLVHTVASRQPGAGRALLDQVNAEADRRGWTLVLDAANERLASYYSELGFTPSGAPVRMPTDELCVPMVRYPRLEVRS